MTKDGTGTPPKLPLRSDSDTDQAKNKVQKNKFADETNIRLLISACLLGEKVRYDGQHKYDSFLVETLGPFVQWERVCPESDSGMPIPRPSMHLVGDPDTPRLISRKGEDLTEQMSSFTESFLDRLESIELCGYICKKDSPSSGLTRVKIYNEDGGASRVGSGLFTAAFKKRYPLIPIEEEGRLRDAGLRELFIQRVFSRRRWMDMVHEERTRGRLVDFHSNHKFLLLSHGRKHYSELGKVVASAKSYRSIDELFRTYERVFFEAIQKPVTIKKTTDVLQHMMGFFKKHLSADEKEELQQSISLFHRSLVPLIVPLTLIKHYVRKYNIEYLARQTFLSPYPAELMLRNTILR